MLFYGPSNRDCGLRVYCEGQGKGGEEGRAEAASQATCKGSEEIRSGITFNPTGTLARGFQQQAPNLFVCLPVFPPSCVAPAVWQERYDAPARRALPVATSSATTHRRLPFPGFQSELSRSPMSREIRL